MPGFSTIQSAVDSLARGKVIVIDAVDRMEFQQFDETGKLGKTSRRFK